MRKIFVKVVIMKVTILSVKNIVLERHLSCKIDIDNMSTISNFGNNDRNILMRCYLSFFLFFILLKNLKYPL